MPLCISVDDGDYDFEALRRWRDNLRAMEKPKKMKHSDPWNITLALKRNRLRLELCQFWSESRFALHRHVWANKHYRTQASAGAGFSKSLRCPKSGAGCNCSISMWVFQFFIFNLILQQKRISTFYCQVPWPTSPIEAPLGDKDVECDRVDVDCRV